MLKPKSMSSQAHCEFVNDDSPPFLFILPPLLSVCPTISISLPICPTEGFLDISSLELFMIRSYLILETEITATLQILKLYTIWTLVVSAVATGIYCPKPHQ